LEKQMPTKDREPSNLNKDAEAMGKVTHRFPMPLYRKVSDDRALREFDEEARRSLTLEEPLEYAVEPSIEGVPVEMVYENSRLEVVSTRGDGSVGYDITRNAKTILTVPLRLEKRKDSPPLPQLLVVWGRIYMESEPFEALNRRRETNQQPAYRNPAEAAANSLLQLDPKISATRPLNVFCSGAAALVPDSPSETHMDLMLLIQSWGLRVNRPHLRHCKGIDSVIKHCHRLEKTTAEVPYPVEGALIHVNRLPHQRRLVDVSGVAQWAAIYPFQ
jgi:DNA ligase (NAD+)